MIRLRLRQWRALPASERVALIALMAALPLLSASLRLAGFVRTRRWLEQLTQRNTNRSATVADVAGGERLAHLAAIAGTHGLLGASCLRQALLVHGVLRWQRLTPSLKIGVRRVATRPDMHAWVELGGIPLGQSQLSHAAFEASPLTPSTFAPPTSTRHTTKQKNTSLDS